MTPGEPNQAIAFHDQLADRWEEKYAGAAFGRRALALLTLAGGVRPGEHWLDAGCGTGTLARRLAQQGCRVTAVDGSARMIESAGRAAAVMGAVPPVTFLRVNDVVSLPFADRSFDGVMCSSVLEYVDSPTRVLAELARVLRPGGTLRVSVPNRRALLRRTQKIAHWSTARLGLAPWPKYLGLSRHEYTGQQFVRLLATTALEVRAWRYYGPRLPAALADTRYGGTLLLFACVKVDPSGAPAAAASG